MDALSNIRGACESDWQVVQRNTFVSEAMRLLFSCKGRLSLAEFRRGILWFMAAAFVLTFMSFSDFAELALIYLRHGSLPPVPVGMAVRAALFAAGWLALVVIWQVLAIKRAHDLGKSAAWALLSLFTLPLLLQEGEKADNRYGPAISR